MENKKNNKTTARTAKTTKPTTTKEDKPSTEVVKSIAKIKADKSINGVEKINMIKRLMVEGLSAETQQYIIKQLEALSSSEKSRLLKTSKKTEVKVNNRKQEIN